MKKLIAPIAFIIILISGCEKYASEISDNTFYDVKNVYSDIHFESDKNDKSKGTMIFQNLSSDGHVTTKVYYNYQITGKLIDVDYTKADIGEVPHFKQFTIDINKNGEVGGVSTNLNGEVFMFWSQADLLKLKELVDNTKQ